MSGNYILIFAKFLRITIEINQINIKHNIIPTVRYTVYLHLTPHLCPRRIPKRGKPLVNPILVSVIPFLAPYFVVYRYNMTCHRVYNMGILYFSYLL